MGFIDGTESHFGQKAHSPSPFIFKLILWVSAQMLFLLTPGLCWSPGLPSLPALVIIPLSAPIRGRRRAGGSHLPRAPHTPLWPTCAHHLSPPAARWGHHPARASSSLP